MFMHASAEYRFIIKNGIEAAGLIHGLVTEQVRRSMNHTVKHTNVTLKHNTSIEHKRGAKTRDDRKGLSFSARNSTLIT